jgi:hypothetical protein
VKENYLQNDLSEQELLESVVEFLKTQGETLEEKIDLEYSLDKSITNNQAIIGYTYNKKLNIKSISNLKKSIIFCTFFINFLLYQLISFHYFICTIF